MCIIWIRTWSPPIRLLAKIKITGVYVGEMGFVGFKTKERLFYGFSQILVATNGGKATNVSVGWLAVMRISMSVGQCSCLV